MIPSLTSIDLDGKRVLLRADLNDPIQDNCFTRDYRLTAILPTIDYLQKRNAKIILLTHLGRPQEGIFDENLSTKIIQEWFVKQGYAVEYEIDLMQAITKSPTLAPGQILLIENLRFFNGEKEATITFAELLAQLGDVYVNDAFGTIHRSDTSITLLAQQFDKQHRACGLLIEREIHELSKIKYNPIQPFFIVLGGCKLEDKIGMLEELLEQPQSSRVNTIIAGGLIGQALLAAQQKMNPPQQVTAQTMNHAHALIQKADAQNVSIVLPTDFLVTLNDTSQIYAINQIPSEGMCVDIGPESIKNFTTLLNQAKTVFINGTMGIYEQDAYAQGTKAILEAIAQSSAYKVIGGGDAVSSVFFYHLEKSMNYLSTGGGATLAYLATSNPMKMLPGLQALSE